jgi:hypothetical protein
MDFKNWLLLLSVLGIIGFSSYYIYNTPYIEERIGKVFPTVTPQVAGSISYERPSDWREYNGETIKFYHPDKWQPEKKEPFGGTAVEDIVLNIPDAIDNNISYSVTSFDLLKPEDIVEEEEIVINDRSWTKWIREGEGYASYDFYTKEHLKSNEAESFGVHVTISTRNEELEKELLVLINSIEFNNSGEPNITTESTEETD